MFYDGELRFLCSTFQKSGIKVSFVTSSDPVSKVLDDNFIRIFQLGEFQNQSIHVFLKRLQANTLYRLKDASLLCYLFLLLPNSTEDHTVLVLGPFLSEHPDANDVLKVCELQGFPPAKHKQVLDYYLGLPVVQEFSHLFVMLEAFCELIWNGNTTFIVRDVSKDILPLERSTNLSAPKGHMLSENANDVLVDMEIMEKRYTFENELMMAVTQGNAQKGHRLLRNFSESMFEMRASDSIRNLKNYCIIMNTLLRKAAEHGGVHPFHINKLSSQIAIQIEQCQSDFHLRGLMGEMLDTYCSLVRTQSTQKYSTIVQKTIALISADLSADLSLNALAKPQNISSGYLSALFKKETGKTITEYILNERMQLALHLLSTTKLQVQTVALHCGIMDVQYFSKVFKKHTGKTPNEYRKSIK